MKQSNFIKIYTMPLMFISPMITISCNSWFSIWMMMELNLMTFIPLIIYFNKFYKNLAMKYFLIQSISSSIMILSANNTLINMNLYFILMMMLNLSMFIKLGTPPFQLWFINLMKNMNWINCLILSTWQKIIPMVILMYIMNKMIMILIILISTIIGVTLGLNHQSLRIIFSFSSINHMSWMILNLMISEMMWMLYFLTYMIINWSMMLMFHQFKIFYINQITNIYNFKFKKLFIFINLITLSGLPPFIGFKMKWMSLYFFMWNKFYLMNLMMLFMSIISFMFYIRISLSFLILSNFKNKLILINKFFLKKNIYLMMLLSMNLNLWIMSIWIF